MKKLIWWGSVFWNAPRLHPVCNKPWDQTKQNATEHKDKNCLSLDAPLRYQFLVDALSARFDYVTINLRHRSRYENVLFENRELCLYRPGKMKIISIQSDTELLSLSRPCSSVCVERKTFVWVTIQGVWIQREKKNYIPFSVSWIHSQTLQDTYARTSEIKKISKRVPSRLERPLPTHTTYLRTPNSTNLFHIHICKKCEELRGTLYVWGEFPYPGSKWSLCLKCFFFLCGRFVCRNTRKPIRFNLKNLNFGNLCKNFQ